MVYGLLSRHDLVQCVRVNKEWHTVVIPYLWKDLSHLNASPSAQRQAFTTLLLEDYLHDQQKAGSQQDETGTEQLVQAQPPSPSALAKYGCWIQTLPSPRGLVRLSDDSIQLARKQTGQDKESVEQELLLHLFKRYHIAQLSQYSLDYHLNEETMAQLVLPRVRHLIVRATYRGKRGELWKLKRLLGRCSTALEKLTIKIDYEYGDLWSSYFEEEEEEDTAGPTEWPSLKKLTLCLQHSIEPLQPTPFWSWLNKRCSQVEGIDLSDFLQRPAEDTAENMSEHMPKLNEITIGGGTHEYSTIHLVENLLSRPRNRWKVIALTKPVRFLSS
jgi:hypothetical protein